MNNQLKVFLLITKLVILGSQALSAMQMKQIATSKDSYFSLIPRDLNVIISNYLLGFDGDAQKEVCGKTRMFIAAEGNNPQVRPAWAQPIGCKSRIAKGNSSY